MDLEALQGLGWSAMALATGRKVLGPTVDLMAEDLKQIVAAYRQDNLTRILERAARRTQPDEQYVEAVHPRVAHEILEQGSWADDEVMQEYLAGLLIASRSEEGKADDGAYMAGLVGRMAAVQVRLHNAFYGALVNTRLRTEDEDISLAMGTRTNELVIWATYDQVHAAVGTDLSFDGVFVLTLALRALHREGLCADYGIQPIPDRTGLPPSALAPFTGKDIRVHLQPNALGADLFLWSRGLKYRHADYLRGPGAVVPPLSDDVPVLGHWGLGTLPALVEEKVYLPTNSTAPEI